MQPGVITMKISLRQVLSGLGALVFATWANASTPAVTLPSTLTLVVPFGAGGALDSMARIFADRYQAVNGRRVIVENKPGASTTIAASHVSRAKPDGSTLLWTTGGHTTNAVLMKSLPYDSIKDFTPLTIVYRTDGFALLTSGNSPWNSVQDVIEAARKEPGKISYGSAGVGNTTHVVGALFAKHADVDLLHVPYKSTPIVDVMSGVVNLTFIAPSSLMPYLRDGRLKALAITGKERARELPNVPTFAELGFEEVDIPAWIGLLAPPNMEPEVLDALYAEVKVTLEDPIFQQRMQDAGNTISGIPPSEFSAYIASEIDRYSRILPPLGISID